MHITNNAKTNIQTIPYNLGYQYDTRNKRASAAKIIKNRSVRYNDFINLNIYRGTSTDLTIKSITPSGVIPSISRSGDKIIL